MHCVELLICVLFYYCLLQTLWLYTAHYKIILVPFWEMWFTECSIQHYQFNTNFTFAVRRKDLPEPISDPWIVSARWLEFNLFLFETFQMYCCYVFLGKRNHTSYKPVCSVSIRCYGWWKPRSAVVQLMILGFCHSSFQSHTLTDQISDFQLL